MAGTQTNSVRTTSVVDGTTKYTSVTTCTIAGTLPDSSIFLLSILTLDDPKDDQLVRVVEVADTVEYSTNRDSAIAVGDAVWRSPRVTLIFDDIEAANAAWKELESRISKLVRQIDAYSDEYTTDPTGDITVYPTPDISETAALEAAFLAAQKDIADAEAERDAQQRRCTSWEESLAITQERLTEAEGDLGIYLKVHTSVGGVSTSLPTVNSAVLTANAQARAETTVSAASAQEKLGIEIQHGVIDTQTGVGSTQAATLAATQAGDISTSVSTLQQRVNTLTAKKSTTLTSLNACGRVLSGLEGNVDAARAARDTALAAIRAVCPTYVPEPA